MPAIDRLMKKLGYVKLSSYGLVLTPEGRVLSMRPAVLDDGLGGRIVGWADGDLAAAELEKWEPARPAPQPAVATRVAAPRPPVPTKQVPIVSAPAAVPAMVVRETSLPITVAPVPTIKQPVAPAAVLAPLVTPPVNVAPEPPAEEDDWEWTIAIARARAAAEEAELAASAPPPPAPKFVPAKTLPIAKVAESKPDPIQTEQWGKTEPLGEIDYNDYTSPMNEVVRVVRAAHTSRVSIPAKATPPRAMPVVVPVVAPNNYPRAKSPVTVIPIPKLPTVANPRAVHVAPVVRAPSTPVAPPRRMAKGTGPYLPKTAPMAAVSEPSEDTVPGMVLPQAAHAVALPSIVKRASRG